MWVYTLLFMVSEYRINFVQQTVVFITPSYRIISRLHGKLQPFGYYFIITDLKETRNCSTALLVALIYRVLSKSANKCRFFFLENVCVFLYGCVSLHMSVQRSKFLSGIARRTGVPNFIEIRREICKIRPNSLIAVKVLWRNS